MKSVLMLAAALGAAALSSAAQAADDSLIPLVARVCESSHGDLAKVRSLALSEGFTPAPATDKMEPVAMITTATLLYKGEGTDRIVLFYGTGTIPNGTIGINTCGAGRATPDLAGIKTAARARFGFDQIVSNSAIDLYGYSESGGKRTPYTAAQDDEAKAAAERGDMSIYFLSGTPTKAVVAYGVSTGKQP